MADSVAEPGLPDAPEDIDLDDDLDVPRVLPQMIDDVEAPDVPADLELLPDDLPEDLYDDFPEDSLDDLHDDVRDDLRDDHRGGLRDERGERPRHEPAEGPRDREIDEGYEGEPWWMSAPDVRVAEGPIPGPPSTVMDGGHASGPLPVLPIQAPPPLPEHRVPDSHTSGGWQVVPDGPVEDSVPPLPAPYQPKRRGRGGLLIGTALSAGICLLALIAAGVLYTRMDDGSGSSPKLTRAIAIVPVAGGLTKSPESAATTAAYPFIQAGVRAARAERPRNVAAVYAGVPMAPRNVVFYGGTGDLGDPEAFLRKSRPNTVIATVKANPGRGGGQGLCGTFAVLSDVHVYCAWATRTSFGIIADNAPTLAPDTAGMAVLMAKMRPDLEKKAS
ncbi:hypothetical protein [Actinomadura rudentiformis]|uniref:Uncharacterized protein n=1 Tax=Actinomadura rudentiformis TaxID=359158 RepID=A0A6H9Y6H2_9ACTN|nr:hypothetical protein [Actinomadura rudentiformis]KAB2339202.1 hypothetical protein F8566_48835 [Actinomadura rudentiformis]